MSSNKKKARGIVEVDEPVSNRRQVKKQLSLDPDTWKMILEACAHSGRSISGQVEEMLRFHIVCEALGIDLGEGNSVNWLKKAGVTRGIDRRKVPLTD